MADYKLRILVEGKDAGASKTLDAVGKKVQSFGQGISGIGGTLSLAVSAPIAGIFGAAISASAGMETLTTSFTTMLGSADKAKSLLADIQDFAASTPFETTEIANAAKQLLAFGVAGDDIIPTLTNLGDIAAGLGIPIGDLAYLFGTAKAQGRLFMADINQLSSRGVPILDALAKTMGVTTGEVRGLVEAGKVGFPEMQKALQSLTAEGGQFAGLMEAQSGTLSGMFSTLKDDLNLSLTAIGDQIVETFDLKNKLKGALEFTGSLKDSIIEFSKTNPELFKMAILFAAAAAAIGPLLVGLGLLVSAIGTALPVIGAIGAAIAALFSPVTLAAAAIGALAYAIYKFDIGGIRTGLESLSAGFKTFLSSADFTQFQSKVTTTFSELWDTVKGFFRFS